jgi:hypothetical protein
LPDTFQALGVLLLALLPGALYVWSFERLVGAWGISLSDRVLRFVGVSAILHVLVAPATFLFWRDLIRTGRLAAGEGPLWLWPVLVGYVAFPIGLGSLVGIGTRRGWEWVEVLTGPDPAPRAWDYVFAQRPQGWIRLRLKSGSWLGGAYAVKGNGRRRSYASGYPEAQDLFLVEAVELDPETGKFVVHANDRLVLRRSGILARWDEVEYLEVIDA